MLVTKPVLEAVHEVLPAQSRIIEIAAIGTLAGSTTLKRDLWEQLKKLPG